MPAAQRRRTLTDSNRHIDRQQAVKMYHTSDVSR